MSNPNPKDPRMFKPLLLLSAFLWLAGCDSAASGAAGETGQRLAGEWILELRIAHPPQLGTDPARLPPVVGSVALLPNQQIGRVGSLGGVPTNYGSHTLDLSPLV